MFSLLVVHVMIDLLFFFPILLFSAENPKMPSYYYWYIAAVLFNQRTIFQSISPSLNAEVNQARWKELFTFREGIPLNRLMISHPLHCLGFTLNIPKLRERDFGIIWNLVILNMNWFCKELLSNVFDFLADLTMITMLLNWLL